MCDASQTSFLFLVVATLSDRHPREKRGPVLTGVYWIPAFAGMTACCLARGAQSHDTGVKNGSGAPVVGLNTTLTFWPIFSVSRSQSTKLVCSDGPSFKV